jgi:hypothetical protein
MHEKVLYIVYMEAYKKDKISSKLVMEELSKRLRVLGQLGDNWSHKWEDKDKDKLKGFELQYAQSARIFTLANMKHLRDIAGLVCGKNADREKLLENFLESYVKMISLMTLSREYVEGEIDDLDKACNDTYKLLVEHFAGHAGITNYFHCIGVGHLVWLSRIYGNLWRFRNEGVEEFNKIVRIRHNKFNNLGHKGGKLTTEEEDSPAIDEEEGLKRKKRKCKGFEVLGNWFSRYVIWMLGLGDALFVKDENNCMGPNMLEFSALEEKFVLNPTIDVDEGDEDDDDWLPGGDDDWYDSVLVEPRPKRERKQNYHIEVC